MDDRPAYYEFFAGGGMARAGLGEGWRCLFANDFDAKKAESYRANWGGGELHVGDVRKISTAQLPGRADLVWASFPCQDLSLAGAGAGLKGERSGTFWPFWSLMKELRKEGRHPPLIVLENVCGALTSHGGKDFTEICKALADEGYKFGALVIDAALFLPQSRPRLFIIAAREDVVVPSSSKRRSANTPFHTRALQAAYERLPTTLKDSWLWWRLPTPPKRKKSLASVIEKDPGGVAWHESFQTKAIIDKMSPLHRKRLAEAKKQKGCVVGAAFKRMRTDGRGQSVQRTEVRFDGVAGCLRTPAGGSSRQILFVVKGAEVRTRLISAREAARLMGLSENYRLPKRHNEAIHLIGDGLAIPVVRFLAKHLIEILLQNRSEILVTGKKKIAA